MSVKMFPASLFKNFSYKTVFALSHAGRLGCLAVSGMSVSLELSDSLRCGYFKVTKDTTLKWYLLFTLLLCETGSSD